MDALRLPRRHPVAGALARGRWKDAARAAERALREGGDLLLLRSFAGVERGPASLRRVERLPKGPWRSFFRVLVAEPSSALADLSALARLRPARYAWMRQYAARTWLYLGRRDRAAAELRAALAGRPRDWWAFVELAELEACRRRAGRARVLLERACAEAPAAEKGEALVRRARVELWLGGAARARRCLDEAEGSAPEGLPALRGALEVLAGRPRAALRWLEPSAHRLDDEGRAWLAEARLRAGRPREALEAVGSSPGFWAAVNRGLALARLGDAQGARREAASLPPAALERLGPGSGAAVLERALKRARGFRAEAYEQVTWL